MAYNVSFEDSSPLISYEPAGAWNDTPQDDFAASFYSSSSFHTTAMQGASLSFSFNGTGVWLYGARRPDYGAYSISVDGRLLLEDDANNSTPAFQQLLGSATGLEMGLHQVTLTNTESLVDLDYILFEAPTAQDVTASTITFDDTDPNISYDSRWTKGDHIGFYNSTIHSTQNADAAFQFSFDGEAIAIYGTAAPSIGDYIVNLDGVEHQLNGGSDGIVRVPHEQTLLYFANNIGAQSHNLVIRANPWELGDPSSFKLDAISVLSTSKDPASVPDASSATLLQSSSSGSPNPTSTSISFSDLTPASTASTYLTNKGMIAAAISAGVICLLAIVFLSLFCLRRHHCDPPSYKDMGAKVSTRSPITPGLPIQDVEKYAGLDDKEDHPIAYREFSPYVSYHESLLSRSTLYEGYSLSSYYETRSTMSSVGSSTRRGHRRNGSDTSVRSGWSYSSMSNESCRILINEMPLPPQFQMPRKPVPSVGPLRPSRPNRETMQIPF